jgi:hypothetical protein
MDAAASAAFSDVAGERLTTARQPGSDHIGIEAVESAPAHARIDTAPIVTTK